MAGIGNRELLHEGISLPLIQRQLGHSHLSPIGTYLQGIDFAGPISAFALHCLALWAVRALTVQRGRRHAERGHEINEEMALKRRGRRWTVTPMPDGMPC